MRDCAVFFTHRWDERIARHFHRFQREAGREAAVRLAYQLGEGQSLPDGVVPDIVVTDELARLHLPHRHARYRDNGSIWGYVDLFWLTAFADPSLAGFERVWLVEYDVDFAGDWGGFFRQTAEWNDDLLVAHLRRRASEPGWNWSDRVHDPLGRDDDHLIGFFPISRFSRAARSAIEAAFADPAWGGHFEMLIPTIVARAGLTVGDMGGDGDLTARARRGRHYSGDFVTLYRAFYSYGWGPPMQHYYGESRAGYWSRNLLYHPIKTGLTGVTSASAWWMKFRDRLLAAIAGALGRRDLLRIRWSQRPRR